MVGFLTLLGTGKNNHVSSERKDKEDDYDSSKTLGMEKTDPLSPKRPTTTAKAPERHHASPVRLHEYACLTASTMMTEVAKSTPVQPTSSSLV